MYSLDKMIRMIKAKTEFRTNAQIGAASGVTGQAIHNMTKSNSAKIGTLNDIAKACGVTLSELISWSE